MWNAKREICRLQARNAELELQWSEVDYLDLRRNTPLEEAFRANAEALGRTFFPLEKLPASLAGSTDMGNISHRVPSIHPMLAAAPLHCTIHNPEFSEHARAESGDRAVIARPSDTLLPLLDS